MKGGDIRKRILPPFFFCLESCLIMSVDLEKCDKMDYFRHFGRIIAKIEHLKS